MPYHISVCADGTGPGEHSVPDLHVASCSPPANFLAAGFSPKVKFSGAGLTLSNPISERGVGRRGEDHTRGRDDHANAGVPLQGHGSREGEGGGPGSSEAIQPV